MCNGKIYFFECGRQAGDSKLDFCSYFLNTLGIMGLTNYSEYEAQIAENGQRCHEIHQTVFQIISGMCPDCWSTSNLAFLAAERNERLSIHEKYWPVEPVPELFSRTSILDDLPSPSDNLLEMRRAATAYRARLNRPRRNAREALHLDKVKFSWIYENESVESLYKATRPPPETDCIPSKQKRLFWIEEYPSPTSSPLPRRKKSRKSVYAGLPKMSSSISECLPGQFPSFSARTEALSLTSEESPSLMNEILPTHFLEQFPPRSPFMAYPVRARTRKDLFNENLLNRELAISNEKKWWQHARQLETNWRVPEDTTNWHHGDLNGGFCW